MSSPTLGSVLFALDANGQRVCSDEEVVHALPWLVLILELPQDAVPEDLRPAFFQTLTSFGVTGTESASDVAAKVATAYVQKPISPRLVAAVDAWARVLLGDASRPAAEQQKLAAFLGTAKAGGVLGGGARPAGSTAAGPLARFSVNSPKK
jgi:hypothetical protein